MHLYLVMEISQLQPDAATMMLRISGRSIASLRISLGTELPAFLFDPSFCRTCDAPHSSSLPDLQLSHHFPVNILAWYEASLIGHEKSNFDRVVAACLRSSMFLTYNGSKARIFIKASRKLAKRTLSAEGDLWLKVTLVECIDVDSALSRNFTHLTLLIGSMRGYRRVSNFAPT